MIDSITNMTCNLIILRIFSTGLTFKTW